METDLFHPLVHCSDVQNHWDWVRLKPGACNTVVVSHVSGRVAGIWVASQYFPRHTYWALDQHQSNEELASAIRVVSVTVVLYHTASQMQIFIVLYKVQHIIIYICHFKNSVLQEKHTF